MGYKAPMVAECQAIHNVVNVVVKMKEKGITIITGCKVLVEMVENQNRRDKMGVLDIESFHRKKNIRLDGKSETEQKKEDKHHLHRQMMEK